MKLITINVEDEEHKAIKLAATEAGLSIKDYLLNKDPVRAAVQPKEEGVIPMTTAQPIVKTKEDVLPAIKQLFPDAQIVEPLYRDKKNKKL